MLLIINGIKGKQDGAAAAGPNACADERALPPGKERAAPNKNKEYLSTAQITISSGRAKAIISMFSFSSVYVKIIKFFPNHVHDLITPPPPSQGQDLKVSPHGCSFGEHKSRSHTRSRDFSHDRRGNYKSPSNSGQKGHDLTSDNFSTIGGESSIIVATRKLYEVN